MIIVMKGSKSFHKTFALDPEIPKNRLCLTSLFSHQAALSTLRSFYRGLMLEVLLVSRAIEKQTICF